MTVCCAGWVQTSQHNRQTSKKNVSTNCCILLTLFPNLGTENILAEINLDSTGVIKGCNIFWGQNFANACNFVGGRGRTQLDEHVEWLQEAIHYSFIKFCIYFFPSVSNYLWTTPWESKKLSTWSWCRTFGISVSSVEGKSHQPIQNLSLCFGVISKTPGFISHNNFVKNFLSASAITIVSWQDVTRSSLCSGVKQCGTKRAHIFLFPKFSSRIRRTTVYGTFTYSVTMLVAIRRSFLTKSATAAMFTSVRVDFGRSFLSSSSTSSLPSRNRECHL